jgi:hypothetical protein
MTLPDSTDHDLWYGMAVTGEDEDEVDSTSCAVEAAGSAMKDVRPT